MKEINNLYKFQQYTIDIAGLQRLVVSHCYSIH